VGGYWLFCEVQQLHYKTLAERLDMDSYAGSQAITIKLSVDEPYRSNMDNYERVDGEFEYEGTTYRLVKQKFYRDTAYIVCYKDDKSIAIKDALTDYVKSFAHDPTDKKSESKPFAFFIKDYLTCENAEITPVYGPNLISCFGYCMISYQEVIFFAIDHPPETLS
jgi:hypothetical protein